LALPYGDRVIFGYCLPSNVGRACDEVTGTADPRIWTARRDKQLWKQLQG
jgi:hypothetical protein